MIEVVMALLVLVLLPVLEPEGLAPAEPAEPEGEPAEPAEPALVRPTNESPLGNGPGIADADAPTPTRFPWL